MRGRPDEEYPDGQNDLSSREYDDAYPTCIRTCCTLRIFSENLDPNDISLSLGMEPTMFFRKGDLHNLGKLRRSTNGWFLTTEGRIGSRDSRRHLDLILDKLEPKREAVKELQAKGCDVDIICFYDSTGQGGPWLMPYQMRIMGALEIEIWYDVYFGGTEDEQG